MKNLILLYLVISFCLVNCVFCYTQTDDLIASSYDWGKKRIDNLANTQGIRVTAGEVTTCFDDPQIIKCVVTNIGSDDLYIDSMAIQPLDPQSVGVFDFVNPTDKIGFLLNGGMYREIEIRYSPQRPDGLIPNLITQQILLYIIIQFSHL